MTAPKTLSQWRIEAIENINRAAASMSRLAFANPREYEDAQAMANALYAVSTRLERDESAHQRVQLALRRGAEEAARLTGYDDREEES